MRFIYTLIFSFAMMFRGAINVATANPNKDLAKQKTSQEPLAYLHIPKDFKIELIARESLLCSPVAFEWGADGKLWVVEMRDYPQGKRNGTISFLTDAKGGGVYDKSTIFLDGLSYPNGIYPWRNGVIVSAGQEIIYAEDTDGDGKADIHKTLIKGLFPSNPQHRVNGFDYGLDNWLYAANGDTGGKIQSALTGQFIGITGQDFRFQPDVGIVEAEAGPSQYGRHRDDWGNWFGNHSTTWLWHYPVPQHYLLRNRNSFPVEHSHLTGGRHKAQLVFPFDDLSVNSGNITSNRLVSACSPEPYRDDLFGPDFVTSVFICEPAHNLVHREVLEPDGVTFKSHRAAGEEINEFLTSSDSWFRPVMAKTGPDGALYVLDMHRKVIEHPEYVPPKLRSELDFHAGEDMGRLYRIYPTNATLRPIPRLDKMTTAELVAALDSPNGWQRDTAQRLLFHAQDKSAVDPLIKLIRSNPHPKTRLQALCTLDGLDAVDVDIALAAFRDVHPSVREHAIRISEKLLRSPPVSELLGAALLNMADDPEIRVRYQLAFSLGEWADSRVSHALAKLALRDATTPEMQAAVLSSAKGRVGEILSEVLSVTNPLPTGLVEQLIGMASVQNNPVAIENILARIGKPTDGKFAAWQFAGLAGFMDALEHRHSSLRRFYNQATPALRKAVESVDAVIAQARHDVLNPQNTEAERTFYVRLLGRGLAQEDEDLKQLGTLLGPDVSDGMREAVLANLKQNGASIVPEIVLPGWKAYLPDTRIEVLNVLLSRYEWTQSLLDAIEKGVISPSQVGVAIEQKLVNHVQPTIFNPARKLFAATNKDRNKLVEEYLAVKGLKGDPKKGSVTFQKNCSMCHRLKGEGHDVGPDLSAMAGKPIETLLTAILDPNQSIEPRFASYNVVLKNSRELSGIISTETPDRITLRSAGGAEETIMREDLKDLLASKISLMPEGFEKSIDKQAMSDLVAFITSN